MMILHDPLRHGFRTVETQYVLPSFIWAWPSLLISTVFPQAWGNLYSKFIYGFNWVITRISC